MRKMVYMSLVASALAAGSIGASYAAGITSTPSGTAVGSPGVASSPGTTTGMSTGAGSAAAAANSRSNPSGNQLMPGSSTVGVGRVGGHKR